MSSPGEMPIPTSSKTKAPSCWAIGGVGCLVLFILILALGGVVLNNALRTKQGKQIITSFKTVIKVSAKVPDCEQRMVTIRQALIRYDLKNARYPESLTDLVPDYLPDASTLHCALDTNPDPSHVSFSYSRPGPGAVSSSPIMTITFSFSLGSGRSKIITKEVMWITLGGELKQQQYQNGKLISGPLTAPPAAS
jgi:hypothetical protein